MNVHHVPDEAILGYFKGKTLLMLETFVVFGHPGTLLTAELLLFSREETVSTFINDTLLVSSDDLTPAMLDSFKIKAESKTKEQTDFFSHREVSLSPVCCLHS